MLDTCGPSTNEEARRAIELIEEPEEQGVIGNVSTDIVATIKRDHTEVHGWTESPSDLNNTRDGNQNIHGEHEDPRKANAIRRHVSSSQLADKPTWSSQAARQDKKSETERGGVEKRECSENREVKLS